MVKILSVIGARPQFIKAAMVSRVLGPDIQEIILHTGQHYDENMSQIFFDELRIPLPEIELNIGGGSHAEQTGQMLVGIERALMDIKPDWVLIYGDTNSTLSGALAASKLHVPVAHVEAGLRSFNRRMPEEINRVICDHISDLLFCPTQLAVKNLELEGIIKGVYCVGDVMGDALYFYSGIAKERSQILEKLALEEKAYGLVTIHRAGNTDDKTKLVAIFEGVRQAPYKVVFPVHPRTRKVIESLGIRLPENILSIDPVGYLDMLRLETGAECILTDSGGVQKEAYWLGIRCVTLRDDTEWVETVEMGWNKLVGANAEAIRDAVRFWHPTMERKPLYGDGHASEQICRILCDKKYN